MDEKEIEKPSKFVGEMNNGYVRGTGGQVYSVHFADEISYRRGGNTRDTCALACRNCGYIESYIEKKE